MDRIEKITIENYKSIDHCSIDNCNEINLLVGPPNSGKSNIIENLSLFSLPVLDVKIVKKINLNNILRFFDKLDFFHVTQNERHEFKTKVKKINNYNYYLNFYLENKRGLNNYFELEYKYERTALFDYESISKIDFNFEGKVINFSNQYYNKSSLIKQAHICFYNFKSNKNEISYNLDWLIPILGNNLGEVIYFNEELKLYIQKELEKIGMSLSIIINDKTPRAQLTDKNGVSILFDFYMLADTFQRIVFYKAAILSNKETILLFEEPEAHCYEPYMIDFVNDILNSGNDNQYFIVTHSDFILQEFLRDEENRHRTNIYIVKNEPNQGTKVKLIDKENKDVYNYGMNVFFNFDSLWAETKN